MDLNHKSVILGLIIGLIFVIVGILELRFYKFMIFELPKKKLWKFHIWPHFWDRFFTKEKLEKDPLMKAYFIIPGIIIIIGGVIFIISSIKLALGK